VIRRVLVAVLLTALAAPVLADDVVAYEAEGDAPATATDPRVAALDDAFAHAAAAAVNDLVAADVRTARKGDLDREIVGHARLWVTKFTVTRDETDDARRQLTVSVKIDRDKIRAKLGELDIVTSEGGAPPPPAGTVKTVTILERLQSASGNRADFGPSASPDIPGVAALTTALRAAGMAVRKAPASGPGPRPDGELPIEDADASSQAEAAKADLALVAGVTIGDFAFVRGQPQPAALVTARLRLVDHGKAIGQGTAIAAARGEDGIGYAVDRALTAAVTDVLPPVPQKLGPAGAFTGDDTPLPEAGVILVRLPSKTPFSMVLDEERYLAGAKGVRSASVRRMSPAGWVIGVVTTDSIERVAAMVKHPPTTDTSASVKIVGDVVEVTLGAAP
jgi:hypothetical protein